MDKLNLRGKVAIIGIAKRLEEIYFPGDSLPLYLDKRSESLKLIQQLRDEAHRFSIAHHRNKRSKEALNTSMDAIDGIGEKTVIELLKNFKSLERIKLATFEELTEIIGPSKSKKIKEFFK